MKEISAADIRKKLRELWKIQFIWLADKTYSIPKLSEIKVFVSESTLDRQVFIEHKNDCDDFALQLHAEAKRYFRDAMIKYPVAFGECFATKWSGWGMMHNGNICICEEGIYLVEPQSDQIRQGDPDSDTILIVKI